MNQKTVLLFLTTAMLYVSLYLLSGRSNEPRAINDTPFAILPVCEKEDTVLSLTKENTPLCLHKNLIYLFLNQEKYTIYELNNEESLLGAFPSGIITKLGTLIYVTSFTDKGDNKQTKEIPIKTEETYAGAFYTNEGILLTTIIPVTSPEQHKSRVVFIPKVQDLNTIPLQHFSIAMVTPKNSIEVENGDTILVFEQPFDFLEPYTLFMHAKSGKLISNTTEKEHYLAIHTHPHFTMSNTNQIGIEYKDEKHVIVEYMDRNTPLEYMGYVDTKTDKTVYNCKDFGQSLQITLRICTPNNEKPI